MKNLGPSFHSELLAAGLTEGVSWGDTSDDLWFNDDVPESQREAVAVVVAAHDPDSPAPLLVPAVVSRFQGREAMHQTRHGDGSLFDAAEAVLAQPQTLDMYRRAWDDLQEFRRDSEMLAAIAGMLGLTAAQIDALFILAGRLKA